MQTLVGRVQGKMDGEPLVFEETLKVRAQAERSVPAAACRPHDQRSRTWLPLACLKTTFLTHDAICCEETHRARLICVLICCCCCNMPAPPIHISHFISHLTETPARPHPQPPQQQAIDAHYDYTPRRFVNGDLESAEGTNAVRVIGLDVCTNAHDCGSASIAQLRHLCFGT